MERNVSVNLISMIGFCFFFFSQMGPEEESDETVESEGHANENEVEEDGE